MKSSFFILFSLSWVFISSQIVFSQSAEFNLDQYKQFLLSHEELSAKELLDLHPAGLFQAKVNSSWGTAIYHDSLEIKYQLTNDELALVAKHGFVVSQRLRGGSFGEQFLDIYHNDMPVFITTDAILHAFHSSYDRILKHIELYTLIPALSDLLEKMHSNLPQLAEKYISDSRMKTMINDVDIYLTVPRILLDPEVKPAYSENQALVDEFVKSVSEEKLLTMRFFSEIPRRIDFSQFKPRGHYTDQNYPQLADYFRAMMWLGRMEIYLLAPKSLDLIPTYDDIQRQSVDAVLIRELVEMSDLAADYQQIEEIIAFFVGEQDNVSLNNISDLTSGISLSAADQLLDSLKLAEFQDYLLRQPYAGQKILSQVLMSHPMNPDSIVPAASFMLFGQRFVIDSYVTGNVVFDRIRYKDTRIPRMLPNTLDIMFALGNDAAAQLLQPELDNYHYGPNLAGLRYLIDSYDQEFWQSSIYNMWLNGIRTLNSPAENVRRTLPQFMQSAAWWQEKLNTQFGSWTELRHDNLLYAKQSYTGGITCTYPYSYVEPVPEFYQTMKNAAATIKSRIVEMPFENEDYANAVKDHFTRWENVMDTLEIIAGKELTLDPLTDKQIDFLKSMMREDFICGGVYDGWYTDLFFESWNYDEGLFKNDRLVADYHTSPTDEQGAMVGWVAHAGTGPVDMVILSAQLPSGENVAFIGPVYSYYEYTTTNFLRLSDEEWKENYLSLSARPEWTNIYLTDENGTMVGPGPALLTHVDAGNNDPQNLPEAYLLATNYPNPFNPATLIQFRIPQRLANNPVSLKIFDIRGKKIVTLLEDFLPGGSYISRWQGEDQDGLPVASGVYIYSLMVGQERTAGKMHLIR